MRSKSLLFAIATLGLVACGISKSRYIAYPPAEGTETTPDETDEPGTETDPAETPAAGLVCDPAEAYSASLLTTRFNVAGCSCHSATPPIPTGNAATDGQAFFDAATARGTAADLVTYLTGGTHPGATQVTANVANFNSWATACDGP